MELTRRNFIGTAAAAGVAAAGGLALSGCSSSSSSDSSSDTTTSTTESVWAPLVADTITDVAETYDCDICVVGAGCAGASAAMYAAMQGASVVIVQLEDKVICTASSGSHAGVWNSKHDVDVEYDIPADLQDFADQANGNFNFKLVKRTLEQTGPVIDWINDTLEVPEEDLYVNVVDENHAGYTWIGDDGLWGLVASMGDKAVENGATLLTGTRGVQLIGDASGVTGVFGYVEEDDTYVQVNAAKGVILCTGDVADNEDILNEYLPVANDLNTERPNRYGRGDGTKMGLQIGAVRDMALANVQIHMVAAVSGATDGVDASVSYAGVPWLHVNKNGERFTNENINYVNISMAVAMQPDHMAYQIFDSTWEEHILDYPKTFFATGEYSAIDDAAAAEINCWTADTIEELADKVGLPSDTLVATVDRYNELVEAGYDEDFGVDPTYLAWNGITEPPYYAVAYWPNVYTIGAGLKVDENLQVLTDGDATIPGLYAAGNASGSFFGYYYPVSGFSAAGVARALTTGALAVAAALGIDEDSIV